MEEFYLVSEVGPLVAKMKSWSMKEEVVDKENIDDKEESAVKKEVSEKVEVTEDVTDTKVVGYDLSLSLRDLLCSITYILGTSRDS